jgi:hypothetical protein
MATELGEVTSYKRLYMQFRDSVGKTINLTLNNPKNLEDGDYVDFAAQDAAIEGVMDTIITKNIFHNNGNDLVAKVNARILDYKSTDVMDYYLSATPLQPQMSLRATERSAAISIFSVIPTKVGIQNIYTHIYEFIQTG